MNIAFKIGMLLSFVIDNKLIIKTSCFSYKKRFQNF